MKASNMRMPSGTTCLLCLACLEGGATHVEVLKVVLEFPHLGPLFLLLLFFLIVILVIGRLLLLVTVRQVVLGSTRVVKCPDHHLTMLLLRLFVAHACSTAVSLCPVTVHRLSVRAKPNNLV